MGFRSLRDEWLARRAGRRKLESRLPRSAREIVGPTGAMLSSGWDEMAEHHTAYIESFDPKVPRSVFSTQQDMTKYTIPIPLVERMIREQQRSEDEA